MDNTDNERKIIKSFSEYQDTDTYKTPKIVYIIVLLVYFGPLVLSIILGLASSAETNSETEISPNVAALSMFLMYLFWFTIICFSFRNELLNAIKESFKRVKKVYLSIPFFLSLTIAVGVVSGVIVNALNSLSDINSVTSENQAGIEDMLLNADNFYIGLLILSVVFMGPIVEELVFRRTIFNLTTRKSMILAYILSSSLFGLLHVVGSTDTEDYIYLIVYISMGLVMTASYHYSKNIMTPILLHILYNAFTIIIVFATK